MITIVHTALPPEGRLICGPRPARPFREGVATLVEMGVSTIACLLDDDEMPRELIAAYQAAALEILRFAIPDFGRPTDAPGLSAFLNELLGRLRRRQAIYLHCFAGLGRTGTVLACLLKTAGAIEDPVALVRAIYDARALETPEQQRFARAFPAGAATRPGSADGATSGRDDRHGASS